MMTLSKRGFLILHFSVAVKALFMMGKEYPWPTPEKCPVCSGTRLWGHGFVTRYFEGFMKALWIKRFRCPDCLAVHTCRPLGFLKGIRYGIEVICSCLRGKIEEDRWRGCVSRQNQQYWYRCLGMWASRQANVIKPVLSHLKDFLFGKTSEHFVPLFL
jgi:hypothetical protein